MQKHFAAHKTSAIIILLLVSGFVNGQSPSGTKLIVSEHKNSEEQISLRCSDTFKINFDGGFNNDIIKITSGSRNFVSDTLNTNGILGLAGTLEIPKKKIKQKIKIYLNNVYMGKLDLKKEYSKAHINNFEGILKWTYINYHFSYL